MPHSPQDQKFIVDVLSSPASDLLKLQVLQANGYIAGPLVAAVQLFHTTGTAQTEDSAPAPEPQPKPEPAPTPKPVKAAADKTAPALKQEMTLEPPEDPQEKGVKISPYQSKINGLGPIEDRDWVTPQEAADILEITIEEARSVCRDESWDTKPLGIGRALLYLKQDVEASKADMKDAAPAEEPEPATDLDDNSEMPEEPEHTDEPPLPFGPDPERVEALAEDIMTADREGAPLPNPPAEAPAPGVRPMNRDPQEGDDGVVMYAGELWLKPAVAAACLNMSTSRFLKMMPTPGTARPVRNQQIDGYGECHPLADIKKSPLYRVDGRMGF